MPNIFIEFINSDQEFLKKYFRSFSARSSVSSVNLEENEECFETQLAINGHLDALDYVIASFNDTEMSIYDIPKIVALLTNDNVSTFRNTTIMVAGSNCERTKPFLIRQELYRLFKDYQELKNTITDPYLLEAIFHIRFLKIHPFEDGNGRCARLLTCFHLISSNLAPIVIPKSKKKYYCDLIENNDFDNLAVLFRQLSLEEQSVFFDIYFKNSPTLTRKK